MTMTANLLVIIFLLVFSLPLSDEVPLGIKTASFLLISVALLRCGQLHRRGVVGCSLSFSLALYLTSLLCDGSTAPLETVLSWSSILAVLALFIVMKRSTPATKSLSRIRAVTFGMMATFAVAAKLDS